VSSIFLSLWLSAVGVSELSSSPLADAHALVEVADNTRENLTKAIALYEKGLTDPTLPIRIRTLGLTDLSRAFLRLGDLETASERKIHAHDAGRGAAERALALDGKHGDAQFWKIANLASAGKARGIVNSLWLVPRIRAEVEQALVLDPSHSLARQMTAEIDHKLPGVAGGSDERAEQTFLEVLKRDPAFTPAMVGFARFYLDRGDIERARSWAMKALSTESSVPNDWRKLDKPAAKQLLNELQR